MRPLSPCAASQRLCRDGARACLLPWICLRIVEHWLHSALTRLSRSLSPFCRLEGRPDTACTRAGSGPGPEPAASRGVCEPASLRRDSHPELFLAGPRLEGSVPRAWGWRSLSRAAATSTFWAVIACRSASSSPQRALAALTRCAFCSGLSR